MPQIAVEVSAPDEAVADQRDARGRNAARARELRLALLAACTDTAGVAECVDADTAHDAIAVALVYWQGRGSVHIEVSSKRVREEEWTERELRFNAGDATIERWRTAGYAVGTVAGELVRLERRRKQRETAASPTGGRAAGAGEDTQVAERDNETRGDKAERHPPGEAPERGEGSEVRSREARGAQESNAAAPSTELGHRDDVPGAAHEARPDAGTSAHSKHRIWWAEAGGLGGPGPYGSAWKIGAYARLSRVFDGPFVTASFGYAARSDDDRGLSARWITASTGVGYAAFIGTRVVLDVRGEIAAEHLGVSVDYPPAGRFDTAGRWMGAFRTGGEVAWIAFEHAALLLGADATIRPAGTDVIVGDELVGAVESSDYSLLAGIRVTWP